MTSLPVSIIGLGLMGEVYATRLIAAGIPVRGFDIDPARRARFDEIGGGAVDSIADVVAVPARCILLAVFSTDQVEDVVEKQILQITGETSNAIVFCTATADPDRIGALAERVSKRGIRFLDVPVSGTSEQVRRGDGVALIGGDPAITQELADIFDALFTRRFHVGNIGDGGRAKLAVNLILGLNRLALAEGLVFAQRMGLSTGEFLEVLRASQAASQVMAVKGEKMVRREYSPQSPVAHTLVDENLREAQFMIETAHRLGQNLPLMEVNAALLAAVIAQRGREVDSAAVIEAIRASRPK
jgi:3-hydroxyisobutyrate dehydrogenase-like beta-hydroxyacid dehydrogenase